MRLSVYFSLIVLAAGCAGHRQQEAYRYSPPVVVAVKSLQRSNDSFVAFCVMTNVSKEPMWFDGEGMQHPAYTIEYKSRPVFEPVMSDGLFWGDTGLGRYKLAPAQSSTFTIRRHEFFEPFRVGVWLSPERDNKTFSDRVYWSETVSP